MTPLRLAADLLSAALGVNLWVSVVFVPALFVGAFARHPVLVALAMSSLLALGVGVLRRSPLWLLLAFPASLLLPAAVDPRIAAEGQVGRLALLLSAASLVGFLFGAAYLTSYAASQPPATRRTLRSSLSASQPARWRRRRRMYFAFTALSVLFPATLLFRVAFDTSTRASLETWYPDGRAPAMLAVLLLGVLAVWLILLGHAVIAPLQRHRTGDTDLLQELDRVRHDSRHGAPRLSFYVGVVLALALMALILGLRVAG